ncbi:MAG: hypothetical protein ACR2NH_04750 [Solirubrobacteraceae bacterium]
MIPTVNGPGTISQPPGFSLTGWDLRRMEKSMPQAVQRLRAVVEQRRPAMAD